MSYAIVRIKQQQFILNPGDTITLNGNLGEVGKSVTLGEVLLLKDNKLQIGTPTLKGEVKFKIISHQKSAKVTVSTFRAKSRFRRTKGHRQQQTTLQVASIGSLKMAPSKTTTGTKKTKPTTKKASTTKRSAK